MSLHNHQLMAQIVTEIRKKKYGNQIYFYINLDQRWSRDGIHSLQTDARGSTDIIYSM